MQLIINIIYSFSIILLLTFSVGISYRTSKFINIAIAAYIALGAYLYYFFHKNISTPFYLTALLAIIINISFCGAINFVLIYLKEKKKILSYSLLIISIGIYVIIQNGISLIWHDDIKSISSYDITVGHQILNGRITTTQIYSIAISFLIIVIVISISNYTKMGRLINATSSNSILSSIFGIKNRKIINITSLISIFLMTVAGIMIGFDSGLTPNMGFNYLLYALVAVIIGGVNNNYGLILGALFLTIAQNLSSYYLNPKLIDIAAYLILILFLVFKPLGIIQSNTKKVNI